MATVALQRREDEQSGVPLTSPSSFGVVFHLHLIVIFLFFGVIGISILYLAAFNQIATQGVIIDQLESKRSDLIVENEVWRMRIAQQSSLDIITHQPIVEKMVGVTEVQYVK